MGLGGSQLQLLYWSPELHEELKEDQGLELSCWLRLSAVGERPEVK